MLDDILLEDRPLAEDLLHGHGRHNRARLTLDDALDDILDMAAAGRNGTAADVAVDIAGQEHGISFQSLRVVLGTDGEDGGEGEL